MHIIKLDAIDSTNSYLKKIIAKTTINAYTVVVVKHQTNGRGQMQNNWLSMPNKNLTFSVYKQFNAIRTEEQFYINKVVCVALIDFLKDLDISNSSIKWPNDILSDSKKIAGVLIENTIKPNNFIDSVIGVGLNVNQTQFNNLPKASSLKNITARNYNLDQLLIGFVEKLKRCFNINPSIINTMYLENLFKKDVFSEFILPNGSTIKARIVNVNKHGQLCLLDKQGNLKEYNFKEIQLSY